MHTHPAVAALLISCSALAALRAQGVVPEAAEPDDTIARATHLPVGCVATGAIGQAGDVDRYRIDLVRPMALTLVTGPGRTAPVEDTLLELRDANDRSLFADDDAPRRGGYSAMVLGLPPGTYYALVQGARGHVGSYTLDVHGGTAPPLVEEGPEPNGAPAAGGTPTWTALDTLAAGAIDAAGDTDWFRFQVPAAQQVLITLSPGLANPALAGGALRLWGADPVHGTPALLASDDGLGGQRAPAIELALPPGLCWVEVAARAAGTGSYLLAVQSRAVAVDAGGGCPGSTGPQLHVRDDGHGAVLARPLLGSTFVVDGLGAPAGAMVVRLVGSSTFAVPLALDPLGTCAVAVLPELADATLADPAGGWQFAVPLPTHPRWRGLPLELQAVVLDPAAGAGALAVSNRVHAVCGTTW